MHDLARDLRVPAPRPRQMRQPGHGAKQAKDQRKDRRDLDEGVHITSSTTRSE